MPNLPEQINEMDRVVELFITGNKATDIAKKLNIPRGRVISHVENWKTIARNQVDIRDRGKETLQQADSHYDLLLKEAWNAIDDAKNNGNTKDHIAAVNLAHTIEKTRVGLYQAAGVTADDKLAEEMMETQRKQEVLVGILRDVACPTCKAEIKKRLSEVTGRVEVVVVQDR